MIVMDGRILKIKMRHDKRRVMIIEWIEVFCKDQIVSRAELIGRLGLKGVSRRTAIEYIQNLEVTGKIKVS